MSTARSRAETETKQPEPVVELALPAAPRCPARRRRSSAPASRHSRYPDRVCDHPGRSSPPGWSRRWGSSVHVIATLPAGVIADRVDRRKLLIICSVLGVVSPGRRSWSWQRHVDAHGVAARCRRLRSPMLGSFYDRRRRAPESARSFQPSRWVPRWPPCRVVPRSRRWLRPGRRRALRIQSLPGPSSRARSVMRSRAFVRRWSARPLNGDLSRTKASNSAVSALVEGIRFVRGTSHSCARESSSSSLLNLGFGGMVYSLNLHLVSIHTQPILIGAAERRGRGVRW